MTRASLSSWKRPRAGLLVLCVSCTLALTTLLAGCGASTGGSDQTGGKNTGTATATSSGSSGGNASPTATTHTGGGSSPTATPTSGGSFAPPFFFTVKATASNSSGDYTIIDNVVSNGDPNLALFATANWNPGGSGGVYDNHALGVYYIGAPTNKWAIYHDDKTPYILNASYNVWVRETTQPGTFIWKATASNSSGDYTILDNAATNGNPDAIILLTHNWNPGGGSGIYDSHALGVFYIKSPTNKWAIYHQDLTAIPSNASYNVYATTADGTTRFVQHACAATCAYDYITINSPASNSKPDAIVFTTANWNPGGIGGVYDNHHLGVFYASSAHQWAVFHQDKAAYIANTSFNVMIPQTGE